MILFFSSQVDTLYSNHFKLFFHSVAQERTLTELISFEIPSWNGEKFRCIKNIFSMMNKAVIAFHVTQFSLDFISLFLKCMISVIHNSPIQDLQNNELQNFLYLYMQILFQSWFIFAHSIFIFWKGCEIIFVKCYRNFRKL